MPRIVVSTRDFNAVIKQIPIPESVILEMRPAVFELHARPNLSHDYVPPATETERSVVAIWQEELGIEAIGIQDSFLELGGDSLIAIKLVSRIRESLGIKVTVRNLYDQRQWPPCRSGWILSGGRHWVRTPCPIPD